MAYIRDYVSKSGSSSVSNVLKGMHSKQKMLSLISQRHKLPGRDEMIAFGIASGMLSSEMNGMLDTAGMAELYDRNAGEALVHLVLREAQKEAKKYREDPVGYFFAFACRCTQQRKNELGRTELVRELGQYSPQAYLSASAATDKGGRDLNQDAVLLHDKVLANPRKHVNAKSEFSLCSQSLYVFGAADGISGGPDGETAARIALESVQKQAQQFNETQNAINRKTVESIFTKANVDVRKHYGCRSWKEDAGGGTTLSVVFLQEDRFFAANVGDSPIWRIRNGKCKLLSTQHTSAALYLAHGMSDITETDRHTLTLYMGKAMEEMGRHAAVVQGDLLPGDTFVLATDGMADDPADGKTAEELVQMALRKQADDNVSAVVVQWVKK